MKHKLKRTGSFALRALCGLVALSFLIAGTSCGVDNLRSLEDQELFYGRPFQNQYYTLPNG